MKKQIEFVEIPAADFNRAIAFYETVFGSGPTICDGCKNERMALFADSGEKPQLAVSQAPGFRPSKNGVLIHLRVEELEKTLSLIRTNGGRVIRPKTRIEGEGRGWFALFADCEGNTLGLYSEH